MIYGLLAGGFALAVGGGMLVLWLTDHRQRRRQLQLRVLAGRQHVLGEEIRTRQAFLGRLDESLISDARRSSAAALDRVHEMLIERQVHLLNCEELTRLLDTKIAALRARTAQPSIAAATRPGAGTHRTIASRPAEQLRTDSPAQTRQELENQLRSRIGQRHRRPGAPT